MHVEGCGGRVLLAGDVADGGEVAADRGHVREGRVSEVVGAEVLGFVFGAQHFSRGLNQHPAVLEAAEDEALVGKQLSSGFVFTRTAPEAVRRAGALRELLSSFR